MSAKKLIHSAIVLLVILVVTGASAAVKVATGGDWDQSSTWGGAGVPASNDTLEIPEGVTVTVSCNCATLDNVQINVRGKLVFDNGQKVNLTVNGSVNVYENGEVSGGNGGSKLNIGGNEVWRGNQAPITTKTTCTSAGCSTNSTLPVVLTAFSAQREGSCHEVQWATATEQDADFFLLLASADGQDWTQVAIEAAAGNSVEPRHYQVEQCNDQFRYYQLKQVDTDGQFEFFGPVSVTGDPDPALSDDFHVIAQEYSLRVIDPDYEHMQTLRIYDYQGSIQFEMRLVHPQPDMSIPYERNGAAIVELVYTNGNRKVQKVLRY